jgi:hypothetical protein
MFYTASEPIGECNTMEPHMTLLETSKRIGSADKLVESVRHALDLAIAGVTKLPPEVLAISGMSGRKYRYFINSLVEGLPTSRYLEIGSWAGSTLCSAIFGNDVEAVAIDNWSQFGGPSDQFFKNLSAFKGSSRVSFLERDFRQVDYASLYGIFGAFGIYLFDGPHEYKDQYDGIVCAQRILEPRYVQIVDDWNWPSVRGGTLKAISDLGLHIDFMAEIRTSLDDKHAPEPIWERSDWHNGYCISVLSRPS